MDKLSGKYEMTLRKYLEKSNQYTKLKKECDILCISNDEQLSKISKLEEELSLRKTDLDNLNAAYADHVNKSLLQYQTISTKLEDTENIVKEQEKQISLLETGRNKKQKQCKSCGKVMKNKRHKCVLLKEVSESNISEKSTKLREHDYDSETVRFCCTRFIENFVIIKYALVHAFTEKIYVLLYY